MGVPEAIVWGGQAVAAPALTSAGQVFRLVQTQVTSTGVTIMNAFHFATDTTGNLASTLANDWALNAVPAWKAMVTNAMTFQTVAVQQTHPTESPVASVTLSGAGSVVSATFPFVCAGVVTWRTTLLGRAHRGRTYICGNEFQVPGTTNGSVFQGTGITRMNTFANAILTRYTLGGNPSGYYLVVWSRKTYNDDPTNWWNAATMVNRYSVQPYVATMGSRRWGRGM